MKDQAIIPVMNAIRFMQNGDWGQFFFWMGRAKRAGFSISDCGHAHCIGRHIETIEESDE